MTRTSWPKGDLRRMLAVVAAIEEAKSKGTTLVRIVSRTGLDKKTVTRLVEQAREQASVEIDKAGPIYRLISLGPVFRREGIRLALPVALPGPAAP